MNTSNQPTARTAQFFIDPEFDSHQLLELIETTFNVGVDWDSTDEMFKTNENLFVAARDDDGALHAFVYSERDDVMRVTQAPEILEKRKEQWIADRRAMPKPCPLETY